MPDGERTSTVVANRRIESILLIDLLALSYTLSTLVCVILICIDIEDIFIYSHNSAAPICVICLMKAELSVKAWVVPVIASLLQIIVLGYALLLITAA